MRWMVFFVVVLNCLVFIWFSFQKEASMQKTTNSNIASDLSNVKSISMLTELGELDLQDRDIRRAKALENNSETQEGGGSGEGLVGQCSLVGPFLEVISVKQAKSRLEGNGLDSNTVSILKVLPVINWVYIPPLPDRKKALAILKGLQSNNIDSFLIADGEFANGISLGFFSNVDSARLVLNERKKQGYPVSLMEKRREQKTYWLAFDQSSTVRVTASLLKSLEEGNFEIKKQEKDCGEVALLPIIE